MILGLFGSAGPGVARQLELAGFRNTPPRPKFRGKFCRPLGTSGARVCRPLVFHNPLTFSLKNDRALRPGGWSAAGFLVMGQIECSRGR
jgi:hypothetical protein